MMSVFIFYLRIPQMFSTNISTNITGSQNVIFIFYLRIPQMEVPASLILFPIHFSAIGFIWPNMMSQFETESNMFQFETESNMKPKTQANMFQFLNKYVSVFKQIQRKRQKPGRKCPLAGVFQGVGRNNSLAKQCDTLVHP